MSAGIAALRRHPWAWALPAFAVVAAAARIGQFAAPLAGDAAQFLYVGHAVAHGGMPYVDAAYSKGPLTALLFAGIEPLAGTSPAAVRWTLVPFAALAALALAAYVAIYAGRRAGMLAGLLFASYSALPVIQGAEGKTEEYGIAPVLGALWLAARGGGTAAAGSGALLACAVLINPALGVALPAVLFELLYRVPGRRRRQLGAMAAGAAVPVAAAAMWLAAGGALDDMVNQIGGQVGDALGPSGSAAHATSGPPLRMVALWAIAVAACVLAWRERRFRRPAAALALLMIAVFLRVKLSSYEFDYQYYPALAGICGALALGAAAVWSRGTSTRAAVVLALAVPLLVLAVKPQIDLLGQPALARSPYGAPVYPVAAFVRAHTAPADRIAVQGARAEVYWRARRRAPDRFFDVYGTVGSSSYPVERARDLLRRPPAAIVVMSPDRLGEDPLLARLVRSGRYTDAYSRQGDHVWLRQSVSSGSPGRA